MSNEFCIMNISVKTGMEWNNIRFPGSERHEAFFGGRNRKKSIEDGLVVFLSPDNHRGTTGIHGKKGHEFDIFLKQTAQRIWMEFYNKSAEDFIKRYGRNYLN